ncbi:MAG: hypothetical protein GY862_28440 [Gammaproteobacteria bacterium]|nr:hypothetical protein [Gammaproteobacteria bacterium]
MEEPPLSIDEFQHNFVKLFYKYKSEKEFYVSILTFRGEVEILSEIEIPDKETLHVKNLAIFPKDEKAFKRGILIKEFIKLRSRLFMAAYELGFKFLRISFERIEASSSVNPNHCSDFTFNLGNYGGRKT